MACWRGPNFALYQAITRFPQIKWQASGGIRDLNDLEQLASRLSRRHLGRML